MPNNFNKHGDGGKIDYKVINIVIFAVIMLVGILNCYVRYVNKKYKSKSSVDKSDMSEVDSDMSDMDM